MGKLIWPVIDITMVSMMEKTIMADSKTINIKLVPQRGCCVGKLCALGISTFLCKVNGVEGVLCEKIIRNPN
jgi:hypothetical protein